jgi:hypothetical protein
VKTVFKYPLTAGTVVQTIKMPGEARIVHVHNQGGYPTLWAEVPVEAHPVYEDRTFRVYGTGWDIDDDQQQTYVGTVHDGGFVWHIYEVM